MGRKTYQEIAKELTHKTKAEENLKKQVSKHKEEALRYKKLAKGLPIQYERIIREQKRSLEVFAKESWKTVFIIISGKLSNKWNELKGRK